MLSDFMKVEAGCERCRGQWRTQEIRALRYCPVPPETRNETFKTRLDDLIRRLQKKGNMRGIGWQAGFKKGESIGIYAASTSAREIERQAVDRSEAFLRKKA